MEHNEWKGGGDGFIFTFCDTVMCFSLLSYSNFYIFHLLYLYSVSKIFGVVVL